MDASFLIRYRSRLRSFILICLLLAPLGARAQQRYSYDDAPLRDVLTDIQERSQYHFLYRDAAIAGRTVSFTAEAPGLIAALEGALLPHGLGLKVDERRGQRIGRFVAEGRVGAFNLYDRKNVWYRNPIAVVRPSPRRRELGFANVDVYELGLQPSFEVKVTF